ncbi:MAG: DNA polymerase III subunit delta [Thermoguttaceae bacterium]|jgi:DNA polymerase-3 subunit delta
MAKATDAIEYLAQPAKYPPRPFCVVFGDELFLRRQVLLGIRHAVLRGEEGDFSIRNFEGRQAEFRDVAEEIATIAMFGGRRLVVVEEADEPAFPRPNSPASFVSRYRGQLEDLAARPGTSGVLVLDVKTWPSNTRLYKAVEAAGLAIDCSAPKAARLARWLADWAKQTHHVQVPVAVAERLVEMIGPELGLLDQELAKLALLAADDKKITQEMVDRAVGWRAKTTWEMLDAALDGKVVEAMVQLDRLLLAGEAPVGLLGQISASLRRLAAATRLVVQSEAPGHPPGRRATLALALSQAGVRPFVIQKTERQLRRLGRARGSRIYHWLLEADLDLKGDSAMPPRLILERLIVRLAAPAEGSGARGQGQ